MSPKKVISLFAGVGGTCIAFKNAGFQIAVANEIDKYACNTYRDNLSTVLYEGCIKNNLEVLKKISSDILIAGFPCQPFSVAGNRLGRVDERGRLIDYIFDIIKDTHPKVVFFENVQGLLSSNDGEDFENIKSILRDLGYNVSYKVIDSFKSGYTRQIRKRLYIVATKGFKFTFPEIQSTCKMRDIDFSLDIDALEYTQEKYPRYFIKGSKIDLSRIECGKFYQIRRVYLRELQNCPTLTANMGTGGHNVPIIRTTSGQIRKLSTRECFNLMGFPEDFKLPINMSNTQLYKQAGNSVVVGVVEQIARNILSSYK
ncbi:MAG: DNA (cytosine-5-)-methyltransferase [Chlamydiia bacterium]|nr:DNA (cytosine-5-)-methyltransferase [Chlamydiia bacterium]